MDIQKMAGEYISSLLSNSSTKEELTNYERVGIAAGGALLAVIGMRKLKGSKGLGLSLSALGGGLVAAAIAGRNPLYALNSFGEKELKAKATCTIRNKSREEVYDFWRKLENLPKFIEHLEMVSEMDKKHSIWKASLMGVEFEWEAEIIAEIRGKLIAWKSLEGSDIKTEGRVEFVDAPTGGTKINVEMKYASDAGAMVKSLASTFDSTFDQQLKNELMDLKDTLENMESTANTVQGSVYSGAANKTENSSKRNQYN